ncbi:hypothetical protein DCAR_0519041 [Daucus carota subsp. sativus]|uniref:Uncharacterized protein n=1 Tax=Daucus carota subsp. sativus TaxID=79200 RepID=A0AAF0X188_DAUCS|nr:PREDICTED: uncharacterized protein LOC108192735 isoform X1 [Daucus carota subsp. sativus]WOG99687.1 hypothetical protein DCAR_0519041 [Daucus carota subsp. sativus]
MLEEVAVGIVKSIFGNASNSKSNFVSSTTNILNGDSTLSLSSESLDRNSNMDTDKFLIRAWFQLKKLKIQVHLLWATHPVKRMKNENSHFSQANHDPHVQDLQRELMHLNKANQDLESMFPWFQNYLRSGNVLERVLALKIELAEALRAKKTSSLHIQRQRKMRICSIVVWKELLFLKSK